MPHPYFQRFESTGTMMQAEQELLELGEGAVSILATFFDGEACNEFGVPYRRLALPLRCAIEVARRLGAVAKPLELHLLEELKKGDHIAAMALGSLGALESQSVEALAQSLDGELDLSFESARALILCGEADGAPVREVLARSKRAADLFAKASAYYSRCTN
jgi:hypothetical protein